MIDVSKLVARKNVAPLPWQSPAQIFGAKPPVEDSEDLRRIAMLPRREQVKDHSVKSQALVEFITARFARANAECRCASMGRECITTLRPVQAWALHEIATTGGLLGCIGVGHGKTILDLLAPLALPECRTVCLLVPPGLVSQLIAEYELVREHFVVPSLVVHGKSRAYTVAGMPVLHVFPYSRLSLPSNSAFLEGLKPDAVIADECHRLRHADGAGTARVLRYFAMHPTTRFCGWTGSMTDSSVKDYGHLSALALRYSSPLPLDPQVVEDWARALDPGDNPAPAGALITLCEPGEHVQSAYHRRLVESRGVVATTEPAVAAELVIQEREITSIPKDVKDALDGLRGSWTRPDGEELVDALSVNRCALELACGLYHRWIFPRGERVAVILEWLDARRDWHREVREKLRARVEHLDSPGLVERAAARAWGDWKRQTPDEIRAALAALRDDEGEPIYAGAELEAETQARLEYDGRLPTWKATCWPRWRDAKTTVQPETQAVRVDDFLARDAAAWGLEHRGVIWYAFRAFGAWVAEISGFPVYGGGPDAGTRIAAEKGKTSIIASIKSHGTGRDGLQRLYDCQLITSVPSSNTTIEQVIGRLHRVGQKAPRVSTETYLHTPECEDAFASAMNRARYVGATLGAVQKLQTGWAAE